jgi:hypothetical protein
MMGRLLAFIAVVAGCYNPPSPVCGFICGTGGACPGGYTCNSDDHRCHLEGTAERCQEFADAPMVDAAPYPMVIATSPNPGDQGITVNAVVTATFNVPIANVDATSFAVESDGVPIEGFADSTDNVATFQPTHLPSGKTVRATITSAVTDLEGRNVPMYTWTFGVEVDTTAPTVTSSVPADGDTGFPIAGQLVTLVFSEDVLGTSNIEISTAGVAIPGTWFYQNQGGFIAQFEPMDLLPPLAAIDVAAPAAITDNAGNALVPFSMQFMTGPDTIAPGVVFTVPPNGSVGAHPDTTIEVTFDEPVTNVNAATFVVAGGLVTGTFASNADGSVWTFTPDAALPVATSITVELTTSITDLAGNPLLPYAFSFMVM